MKKTILAASLICAAAITAGGASALTLEAREAPAPIVISAPVPVPTTPFYMSYTGQVTEIQERTGGLMLVMDSEDQGPANPVISEGTFIYEDREIKVGDTVTIFYESDRPMILIYPPQYEAAIVVVNPGEKQRISADLFDENLLGRGGSMVLTVGSETQVLTPEGAKFEGSPAGNRLLVFYTVSLESYPEQVTPEKIIVMGPPEDRGLYTDNIDTADIVVEGKIIEAPRAFVDENGVIMVPLRAVAEALGYEVTWEAETRTVRLGPAISLTIGEDYYVYGRMAPIFLGTAPVLKDSVTYVPLSYFTEVLRLNNAYFFENQVVIDNQEKMQ